MRETRDFPQRIVREAEGRRGNIHAQSTRIGNGGRPSCYWFILTDLGIYQIFIVCAVVYMRQRLIKRVCGSLNIMNRKYDVYANTLYMV